MITYTFRNIFFLASISAFRKRGYNAAQVCITETRMSAFEHFVFLKMVNTAQKRIFLYWHIPWLSFINN